MYLIFDTETTGLPSNYNAPVTDTDNWPRMVQLAWECHDSTGTLLYNKCHIIKPENFIIPQAAEKVHGITTGKAMSEGVELNRVLSEFENDLAGASVVIGHNVSFDLNILGAEFIRKGFSNQAPKYDQCVYQGGINGLLCIAWWKGRQVQMADTCGTV